MQFASQQTHLPNGWTEHLDPGSGQTFFCDATTGQTTWERPQSTQPVLPNPVQAVQPFQSQVYQPVAQPLQQAPPVQLAQPADSLPQGWTDHVDPNTGQTFFYNSDTGVTSWERPPSLQQPSPITAQPAQGLPQANPQVSTLAHGWAEHVDPGSGNLFYFNATTNETSWERPSAVASAPIAAEVPQPASLPANWTENNDPGSGRTFYFNAASGESSWERPASAVQTSPAAVSPYTAPATSPAQPHYASVGLGGATSSASGAARPLQPLHAQPLHQSQQQVNGVSKVETPPLYQPQQQYGGSSGSQSQGLTSLRGSTVAAGRDGAALQRDFELPGQKLGQGSFGTVYRVRQKCSGRTLVLKKVTKQAGDKQQLQGMAREIEVLCAMDHPHIIRIFGYYEDYRHVYVVMEGAEGGELYKAIRDSYSTGRSIDEGWAATVMQQIMGAIAYCHERGVMHKDLKCENVMLLNAPPLGKSVVQVMPHAVVIDLGLAEIFQGPRSRSALSGGTCTTMAPEVWQGSFGPKCDVWSLGCVLFEMLTGKTPFLARNLNDASEWLRLHQNGPDWNALNHASFDVRQLLKRTLEVDQRRRPGAQDCLGANWLKQWSGQIRDAPYVAQNQLSQNAIASSLSNWRQRSELQKTVCFQVAAGLPSGSVEDLNAVFRSFDRNSTGTLSPAELQAAFTHLGMDAGTSSQAIAALDQDNNGRCEYTEFLAACLGALEERFDDLLWEAFQRYDLDGNGYLSPEEVRRVFDGMAAGPRSHKATTLAATASMRALDTNGDGRVSFDEFKAHFGCAPSASSNNRNGSSLNSAPSSQVPRFGAQSPNYTSNLGAGTYGQSAPSSSQARTPIDDTDLDALLNEVQAPKAPTPYGTSSLLRPQASPNYGASSLGQMPQQPSYASSSQIPAQPTNHYGSPTIHQQPPAYQTPASYGAFSSSSTSFPRAGVGIAAGTNRGAGTLDTTDLDSLLRDLG